MSASGSSPASRDGIGLVHGRLEFVGQQVALGERFDDRVAAVVQIGQADQAFADAGHGDFIQRAGGFLAVAGDEGHRRAFGKQLGRGQHLARLNLEFAGDFLNVSFVHL